jgi:predicted nuclease of predicted toxin-antitoxin system
VKLLFDQNISFRILRGIESHFPIATQVRLEGLEDASDKEIWQYAKEKGYTVVTFDSDFYDFSVIWGAPPKIILIRSWDQTTKAISTLIIAHKETIYYFEKDSSLNCLEITKAESEN